MKNIEDYLYLYLGCECMIGDLNWKPESNLHGLAPGVDPNYGRPIKTKLDAHSLNVFSYKTTLILRPLSDMTEEEAREFCIMEGWGENLENIVVTDAAIEFSVDRTKAVSRFTRCRPEMFRWLLSKSFDLFDLIPAGLAIDKTTVKTESR